MEGKIVLITGANAGIGKATAIGLARMGALVILACRSLQKAQSTASELMQENPRAQFFPIECDLADFQSIRHAANNIQQHFDRLDVLINNAGLFSSSNQKTANGFEMQFGVNHLGHFLLTRLLLTHIQKSTDPRVINVSSIAYIHGDIDFKTLKTGKTKYNALEAYAQSKLANVLFTRELARRYPKITTHCLHPGVVRTRFGNKHSNWYLSLFWQFWKLFMISPKRGAKTSIYLASTDQLPDRNACFFDEHQHVREMASVAKNDILAKRLWDVSETFIQDTEQQSDSQIKNS